MICNDEACFLPLDEWKGRKGKGKDGADNENNNNKHEEKREDTTQSWEAEQRRRWKERNARSQERLERRRGKLWGEEPIIGGGGGGGEEAMEMARALVHHAHDDEEDATQTGDGERSEEEEEFMSEPEREEEDEEGGGQYDRVKGRVTVFTITGCGHCKRAKALLNQLGVRLTEINLDEWPGRRQEMVDRTAQRTVPQIFFNEVHIGGADQLFKLHEEGKLQAYIDLVREEVAPASAPQPPALVAGEEEEEEEEGIPLTGAITCEPDEFIELVRQMRQPVSKGGLSIKNRRYHLRSYRSCFVGCEAVDWLLRQESLELASRKEAVKLGNRMLRNHHFHHVLFDHPFEDRHLFYRFLEDEDTSARTLNSWPPSTCAPRNAAELSQDLRKLVLRVYDEFLSPDGNAVDYEGIALSEAWGLYCRHTLELQRVDVGGLTREEKLAFFINTYNALVIHAYVEFGPPKRMWQRLAFFRSVSYVIGGQVYSLNDIEHGILRANSPPPWGHRNQFGRNDPRLQYCLAECDPRIHFALVCGAKGCPSIRTYAPDKVDEQLDEATRAYFEGEDAISVDKAKRLIRLSKLLSWYGADFGASPKDRVLWVADYAPADKAEALREVADSGNNNKFKLAFLPYDWSVNSKAKTH